jgi:hypothetical protein
MMFEESLIMRPSLRCFLYIAQSARCSIAFQPLEESGASNGITALALHIDSQAPYSGRKGFRSFPSKNSILYNKSRIEPATATAADGRRQKCFAAE